MSVNKKIVYREFIYLNSNNRTSGSHSAFTIPLNFNRDVGYTHVTVTQASIPVSYYLIPVGFNRFQLKEDNVVVDVYIPPGNYNINSFCVEVPNLLNAASPNGLTYTMSYNTGFVDNLDGLIHYTVSGSRTCSLIMSSDNYLADQFGFDVGSTNTFSGGILSSSRVVNFVNETTVFIHSNLTQSSAYNDILQEIYQAQNPSMSYISYLAPDLELYMKEIALGAHNSMTVSITDENNRVLDLNGQNVLLTLCFMKLEHVN